MVQAVLLSIQVGMPQVFDNGDPARRPWLSAFIKKPVAGPIWLGRTNLAGDVQADLQNHGGPDKAVLAYAAAHYMNWRVELGRPDLPYGAFAENFTVDGLDEWTVCIGDVYAIGETQVQVSQPRQACWKISRRWGIEDLTERVVATGRTGWYFRVLVEGYVEPGLPVILLHRPFPQWTVARATEVMRHRRTLPDAARELAACPLLSAHWRETLLIAR
ncbi:MAG: MOSC domain-containing protein [Anaerolineae bacterium]|nr:MOSC domain-containing protein [Anaerolineae bacterium]MDW8101146.1 MOSC domain-containing protein [Anaerolineae bacterium]